MPRPSPAEFVELGAIPLVTALAGALAPRVVGGEPWGTLLGAGALLLLLQGFVRDLWLLRRARRRPDPAATRTARCLCVESAAGLTGIAVAIGLSAFGLGRPVHVAPAGAMAATAAIMTGGFLLKDFVLEWSPWKIRREKDHSRLIFRWGK